MAQILIEVLSKTISHNPADQQKALEFLNNACNSDFPSFVKELSIVLRSENAELFVRQAAGIQLKNVLCAKVEETKQAYLERWLQLAPDIRNLVKNNVQGTIGTETTRPSTAAQCVAAIACAELPRGLWNDVISILMNNVTNGTGESLKEASLETLGYICQDIDPRVLESQANQILTAIVHGMRKEESSNHVRLAATNALGNALEFTHNNFQNDNERNIIMQVVCETSQSPDTQVKVSALQCLVRIMTLYYQLMEPYMNALYPITVQAMKSTEDNVALQGIEFWSNVCEEEISLAVEAQEAQENNTVPDKVSRHYAKGATPHLCPLLLDTLAKQEEGDDDDEWTPCKAAGVCIMLLAQCVQNDIINSVTPFFSNFANPDWRYKDAAIMAFGSILDGPDPHKLMPLVEQALPRLIEAMNESVVVVRDTTAWTIGRILEVCPEIVGNQQLLATLLPVFSKALHQEPRVASNVCWALVSLVKASYEIACQQGTDSTGQPETYPLSPCFQAMIGELIRITDRPDSNQSNLRLAAFETIMELIKNSPKDCYHVVQQTTLTMLEKLKQLLNMEAMATSAADRSAVMDLQGLLCATLQSVLRKMKPEDAPLIADHIMNGLIQIMTSAHGKGGTVMEEALLAVSALAETLTTGFSVYIQALQPHILAALQNYEEAQVCVAAAGLLVDICKAIDSQQIDILDKIMEQLVICLNEPRLSKEAKVQIIGTFGDIAMSVGTRFERYLTVVMGILQTASQAVITDVEDYAQVDYVDSLRENIANAYVGIVQSMITDGADSNPQIKAQIQGVLNEYMNNIAGLVDMVCQQKPEPSATLASNICGLIGDLFALYGANLLPLLGNDRATNFLIKCRRHRNDKVKSLAGYAQKEIRRSQNANR